MNLKERKMVYRVFEALSAVPGAHMGGGMMSVTVSGVANFARDLSEVREHCGRAMLILCGGDQEMSADARGGLFDGHMKKAEAYIARRRATDWRAQ